VRSQGGLIHNRLVEASTVWTSGQLPRKDEVPEVTNESETEDNEALAFPE